MCRLGARGLFSLAPTPAVSDGASSDTAQGDPFSTTNLQEAGVDESDVVKNDGTYIYLLSDDTLRIVQAVPADAMKELGHVDLEGWSDSLYLKGDQVIALTVSSGLQGTIVTLIDATDRSKPAIVQTWQFAASLVTSRLIGDKLHLVLNSTPYIPYAYDAESARSEPLDKLLPVYSTAAGGTKLQEGKLADWPDFYHPTDQQGYGLTVVTTIDLANLSSAPQSTGITADAGVIYASPTAFYVTDSSSDLWYYQRASDNTMVHKFDLSGDRAAYIGSALVPGHLLNQYSLGEKDGYLPPGQHGRAGQPRRRQHRRECRVRAG